MAASQMEMSDDSSSDEETSQHLQMTSSGTVPFSTAATLAALSHQIAQGNPVVPRGGPIFPKDSKVRQFLQKHKESLPDFINTKDKFMKEVLKITNVDDARDFWNKFDNASTRLYSKKDEKKRLHLYVTIILLNKFIRKVCEMKRQIPEKLHYNITPKDIPDLVCSQADWKTLLRVTDTREKFESVVKQISQVCSPNDTVRAATLLAVCVSIEHPGIAQTISRSDFMKNYKFDKNQNVWIAKNC